MHLHQPYKCLNADSQASEQITFMIFIKIKGFLQHVVLWVPVEMEFQAEWGRDNWLYIRIIAWWPEMYFTKTKVRVLCFHACVPCVPMKVKDTGFSGTKIMDSCILPWGNWEIPRSPARATILNCWAIFQHFLPIYTVPGSTPVKTSLRIIPI